MKQGLKDKTIYEEIKKRHNSLINENPVESMKILAKAQGMYGYDPSRENTERNEDILRRINDHFSYLESPISELNQYALLLSSVSDSINSKKTSDSEALAVIDLLTSKSDLNNSENVALLQPLLERLAQSNNSTPVLSRADITSTLKRKNLLSEYENYKCDVSSLVLLKSDEAVSSSPDLVKIIDYINSSLAYTPNERRLNMTIGDYLKHDSDLNLEFIEKIADSVLHSKAKRVAEKISNQDDIAFDIQESHLLSPDVKKILLDNVSGHIDKVYDKRTGKTYAKAIGNNDMIDHEISRDIDNALKMSPTLEHTRSKYENNILEAMLTKVDNQDDINKLVQEWIDLRLIDLKLKPEYKAFENTSYKQVILEKFKQKVFEEIGFMDQDPDLKSYKEFNPLTARDKGAYSNDVYNKNNLNHIMENALGYERLTERLQNPDKSNEIAHPNLIEKEFAKYYIDKRKDYAASKELLQKLDKYFSNDNLSKEMGLSDSNNIGYDLKSEVIKSKSHSLNDNLNNYFQVLKTTQEKMEIFHEDQPKIMQLGDATHTAIYGRNNGVAEELLKYDTELNTWPERLPKFDIRRKPKEWVENKLDEIIKEIFDARSNIEKNMTRNELKAFDQHLAHHFNKDNMIVRLFDKIDEEYAELVHKRHIFQNKDNIKADEEFKAAKHYNRQRDFNTKMKNLDAAYKLIAYKYCQDREAKEEQPPTAFRFFYEKQLQRDIQEPPRPIEEIVYQSREERNKNPYYGIVKKPYDISNPEINDYVESFDSEQGGQLEDLERQEAYYVIQSWHNLAANEGQVDDFVNTNYNQTEEAHKALKDYFSNYENISFFEVNKIK